MQATAAVMHRACDRPLKFKTMKVLCFERFTDNSYRLKTHSIEVYKAYRSAIITGKKCGLKEIQLIRQK